jgi:hypothetical protein
MICLSLQLNSEIPPGCKYWCVCLQVFKYSVQMQGLIASHTFQIASFSVEHSGASVILSKLYPLLSRCSNTDGSTLLLTNY